MDEIILRDDLLITATIKAMTLDREGVISLGLDDKHEEGLVKKFVRHIVDRYIEMDSDMNFDEYIENNLILGFSKDNHLMKGEKV
jgi:hypothetical protein